MSRTLGLERLLFLLPTAGVVRRPRCGVVPGFSRMVRARERPTQVN
jgi:hypothetical protein